MKRNFIVQLELTPYDDLSLITEELDIVLRSEFDEFLSVKLETDLTGNPSSPPSPL